MASLATSLKELVVEGEIDKSASENTVDTDKTAIPAVFPKNDPQEALRMKAREVLRQNNPET